MLELDEEPAACIRVAQFTQLTWVCKRSKYVAAVTALELIISFLTLRSLMILISSHNVHTGARR